MLNKIPLVDSTPAKSSMQSKAAMHEIIQREAATAMLNEEK
jgi:hypothetical protein